MIFLIQISSFALGAYIEDEEAVSNSPHKHIVKININKTGGNQIEGSVPWSSLFNRSKSHPISNKPRLWKSSDDIYTATESISNRLNIKRYLPLDTNTESGGDQQEDDIETEPIIRSFLFENNGKYIELDAKMSKNKINKSSPQGIVCLDYKKTDKLTYENPAFVDSTANVSCEIDDLEIPTDDGRNGLVNHSSVTSNGIPTDDGRNGLVNHSSVTSNGIPTDDGRNGLANHSSVTSNGTETNQTNQRNTSYLSFEHNVSDKVTPTAQIIPNAHCIDMLHVDNTDNANLECVAVSIPDNRNSVEDAQQNKENSSGVSHVTNNNTTNDNTPHLEDEEIKWLSWMEVQFKKIAGDDGEISLDEFKNALGVKKSFFAERFFTLFDSDESGSIECEELMVGLRKLTKGSPTEKLKFLFDVYDVDGSGTIDIDELEIVLRSCMEESSLKLSEDDLDNLTAMLFEAADEDSSGEITFEELKAELEKHPGVIDNLTISAAQWLKPPGKKRSKDGIARYFTRRYVLNNLRKVFFFLWYVLTNIAFGIYAAWNYRKSNGFIIAARICGMNLNFNCMFILVLMLRKSLTYLRMTKIALFLPIDQHILFHKMVGVMIAVYSIVHTVAHFGNAILMDNSREDLKLWEILFTTKAGFGWVYDTAILTGWALDIIVVIMIICSMPFVRRSGYFQVFYWTHMLYVPFWILIIIHGSNFWKWFVAPGLIFIAEKISRSKFIKRAQYGNTYIEEITLLPSGVTHLEITRPSHFSYQPGDYLFIQVPDIAQHEWHPFTISSAPEMEGRLWLHVRSAGHWTKKIYEYFENYDPGVSEDDIEDMLVLDEIERRRRSTVQARRKSTIARRKSKAAKRNNSLKMDEDLDPIEAARQRRLKSKSKKTRVKCFIDGPYGTATREIFDTEHAVLVGAGIGVTPMASILQSIMYRYKDSKRTCPKCSHCWFGPIAYSSMKTKKVDFVWINRDQKSFEWFVSLLTNLEVEQALENEEGDNVKIIDMHMYMTAAQKKTDMKGIGLQIALDMMHEKSNKDLITGLKTKTEPGRPDWNKLFTKISKESKGKVKVFFCGAPQLGKIIKEACGKFTFAFSKENF